MSSGDILVLDGLSKRYASKQGPGAGIDRISCRLESGTFFTLLGPSGCGKTTTLRCIAGLEQPDLGAIRLGPTEFFDASKGSNVPLNERDIGMVFQSYAIWPHMTVFENVAFPLKVARDRSYTREEVRRLVGEALDTVNLGAFGDRSPTQMSGGQQQRVALARAIVRKPRLLLLDEPLSNLDALLREDMRRELKRLQQQLGVTTVYVTHDQAEALEMSDTIAVLNHGNLVQLGTAEDIYNRPRDAFVAGFMGSPNLLRGRTSQAVARDARALVQMLDGDALTVTFPYAIDTATEISVSVRPEIITLRDARAQCPPDTNRLRGVVAHCAFLGHAYRHTVQVGKLLLQSTVGTQTRHAPGSEVAVDFAFDQTCGLVQDSQPQGAPAGAQA
jgi:iron(III) transport system ATP-binding protein